MSNFLQAIIQISVLVSVMIFMVALIKALFAKKMKPTIMSALWIMVLLRLCVPYTIESPVRFKSDIVPVSNVVTKALANDKQDISQSTNNDTTVNKSTDNMVTVTEKPLSNNNSTTIKEELKKHTIFELAINYVRDISLVGLMFIIWCIGAMFMLTKALTITMKFDGRLKRCRVIDNQIISDMVIKQAQALRIKRPIKVIECDHVDVPMVFGYFKPYLLIPKKYLTKNEDNLYYILLHEMCHITRHDILKNYLWLFAKVIYWFNPLVYMAYKMYQDNIELCCDQMVINRLSKDDKYRYSQTLVDVIRMSSRKSPLPVAASLCTSKSVLKERVLMMIQPRKRSRVALVISLVLALAMIVGGFTTACMPEASTIKEEVERITLSEMIQGVDYRTTHRYENVPKTWEEKITDKETGINVYIDTQVQVESETWGIYEVIPMEVDQERIDTMLDALVGDRSIYLDVQMTTEKLNKDIITIKEKIDKLKDDNIIAIYNEQLDIRKDTLKKGYLSHILFNTNVNKLGYIELSTLNAYIDSGKPIENIHTLTFDNVGLVDMGRDRLATLKLDVITGKLVFDNIDIDNVSFDKMNITRDEMDNSTIRESLREFNDVLDTTYRGLQFRVDDSGYGHYLCINNSNEKDCRFRTTISRFHVNHNIVDSWWRESMTLQEWFISNRQYSVRPVNDTAFIVDRDQVLYAEVFAPISKINVIMRGAKLIEFEEVLDILKQNLSNKKFQELTNKDDKNIHINSIKLDYMYTKDCDGRILVVPVWDFYGYTVSDFNMDEYDAEEESDSVESNMYIMTINAVDGSIMNR